MLSRTLITNFSKIYKPLYEQVIARSGIPLTIESPAYDVFGNVMRDSFALHDHRPQDTSLEIFWALYALLRPAFVAKLVRVEFTNIEWDAEGERLIDCGLSTTASILVDAEQYDVAKPADMEAALAEHYGFQLYRCDYKVLPSDQ